jgi:hypothetical protein
MSNIQLDVNKVVESLVNQISQQAQRIAVLEATIDAIQKGQNSAEERLSTTEQ